MNRYKITTQILLFGVLFLISQQVIVAQSKRITLHFPDSIKTKDITIRYYIDNEINNTSYLPFMGRYQTNSDTLAIAIPDSLNAFQLTLKPTSDYLWSSDLPIYVNKSDTVDVYVDSLKQPVFEGANYKGLELMAKLKEGNGFLRSDSLRIEFNKQSGVSIKTLVNTLISDKASELVSLRDKNEIDSCFFDFMTDVVVDEYLYRAGMLGIGISNNSEIIKKSIPLYFSNLGLLYDQHKDLKINTYLPAKAELTSKKLIKGSALDLGLFENLKFNYLSRDEQEIEKVFYLVNSTALGDSTKLVQEIQKFEAIYPDSKYLHTLHKLHAFDRNRFVLGSLSEDGNWKTLEQHHFSDIDEIAKKYMSSSRAVFVDFWATWCGPCIQEFKQKKELTQFLEKNNIAMLYVSVDSPAAYDKWVSAIRKYRLEGLHYLGTLQFVNNISYLKNTPTPRYVLFDQDGSILIERGKFITSGELIPQIKEALNLTD